MGLASAVKDLGFSAAGKALRLPPVGRSLTRLADRGAAPKFQILVYHRVLPAFDPFVISMVPSDLFAQQMRLLRVCYRPVSLDTLVRELDRGDLKPGTVAVTFDDGYRDNHDHALPILKEFGIPATVYLATGLTGTRDRSWYDKVLAAMRDPGDGKLDFAPAGHAGTDISNTDRRAQVAYALLEWFKRFPPAERDAHIETLWHMRGFASAPDDRLMLDWDEARALHASGLVTLGAHTVNHPILAHLDEAGMEREIAGSKKALEDALAAPVEHFAYPNGKPGDYTPATMAILKRLGFKTAVTTSQGVNRPSTDRLQWLRRQPWESDADAFAFRFALERLTA
jgi:peptidoglycan/xylan/chitin deacetylase (PgdA/CDA1 family)